MNNIIHNLKYLSKIFCLIEPPETGNKRQSFIHKRQTLVVEAIVLKRAISRFLKPLGQRLM